MTLQELLKVFDDDMFVAIEDVHTQQEVEGEVGNSIIQRLDGEVKKVRQIDRGDITITVDFADMRGEE